MKLSAVFAWILAAAMGLAVSACDRNEVNPDDIAPPGVGSSEISAIKYYAANDEFVKNDEQTFTDREIQPTDYGTFGKIQANITPLRWGRFVNRVVTNVDVDILPGDTIAIAHVHKNISGILRILALDANGDTVRLQKTFSDSANRNLIFKRVARDSRRYWGNWVPVATSLVEGGTQAPNDFITLTQLDLILPNNDTITVTDPLNTYLRYRWMHRYQGGDGDVPELEPSRRVIVRATLVSASSDTDLVALRFGAGVLHMRRARMQLVSEVNNGNNTYTRVYQTAMIVHAHRGFFHAGVDAMTRETLFDDSAPYSVSWWGMPYRVM